MPAETAENLGTLTTGGNYRDSGSTEVTIMVVIGLSYDWPLKEGRVLAEFWFIWVMS